MRSTTRRIVSLALTWAIALLASPSRAEEPGANGPVDDLDLVKLLNVEVSTATKTAESLEDAPAIITVVTREEIHRWGYQSVADVLTHCVGFYLIDDHILPNAGVRGITGGLGAESSIIKVMIDGRSVAFRTTSGNWLGVELVPLESVKQIEIIRGPVSALYGADAFLGVVNIITEKPDEVRPISARGSFGFTGSNPGGRLDVAGGGQLGPFDLLLGAAGEYTDRSGIELPAQSPAPILPSYVGSRRTADNLQRRSLVLQSRLGYRVERGEVVLSAYASGLERGGDFANWAQLTNGTDAAGQKVGTVVALGQFRGNFSGLLHATDTLDLALESTYFQGGVLPQDRVEIASDLFYIERNTAYRGLDSMLEARWVPSSRASAIAGVETVYDHEVLPAPQRIERASGEIGPGLGSPSAGSSADLVNVGSYLSVNYKLFDPWLKLTGGVRYDHHNHYGDLATGRVGATSRLGDTNLVLKVLYGSAFKAPSPYLLYAVPLRPGDVVGNSSLLPQRIRTLESQLSWKPSPFFDISSGVSYSWLFQEAEFTPQGINETARNVASQRSLSWESQVKVRHYRDYMAYASAEVVHSIRDLGQEGYAANLVGTQNVVYPNWIGRGGAIVGLPLAPVDVGAEAIVVGPRRAADTSIVENGASFTLPAYWLLDLSISTRELYLAPGHESRIAIRAKNVLANKVPDPGFSGFEYARAPREIFIEFQHTY